MMKELGKKEIEKLQKKMPKLPKMQVFECNECLKTWETDEEYTDYIVCPFCRSGDLSVRESILEDDE